MTEVKTGLVEMTNDEYHAGPGISKSHLDKIAGLSPLHYWQAYINPDREIQEQTPAMALGTAVHSAVLEPDLFTSEYVKAEKFDRRTTAGKQAAADFEAAHEGKIAITPEDYEMCMGMRDAVHRHPIAAGLFSGGAAEQTFFGIDPESGELIKCRTDYIKISHGMVIDLKSTEDASPAGFGKSSANFRYPIQGPWYLDAIQAAIGEELEHFVFVAVEKKPPFAIGIYYIDEVTMQLARQAARRDFDRIIECRQADYWPDYSQDSASPLLLPGWAKL